MYRYKTKDGSDIVLPGIGKTVNGEISVSRKIENPRLELVTNDPAPNYVNGVVPQSAQPVAPAPVQETTEENKEMTI